MKKWYKIFLSIILSVSFVFNVYLYSEVDNLNQELDDINIKGWNQILKMTNTVDKVLVENDTDQLHRLRLFVNNICYHFDENTENNSLTIVIRKLLIESYDFLFAISFEHIEEIDMQDTYNMILKSNTELRDLVKSISDDMKKGDFNPESEEYIEMISSIDRIKNNINERIDIIMNTK